MSQVAHVYKITNPSTGQIYIGSTYNNPEVRFQHHKYHYNNYINNNSNKKLTAFKLFENNCMNICYVSTIESLVVNSIYELRMIHINVRFNTINVNFICIGEPEYRLCFCFTEHVSKNRRALLNKG